MLQRTGLLCESGATLRITEDAPYELPDHTRVAPMHMACVGATGEASPHFARAALVAWLLVTVAWFAAARLAVRKLVGK